MQSQEVSLEWTSVVSRTERSAAAVGLVISEIQSDWIVETLSYSRAHWYMRIEAKLPEEKGARITNEACHKTLLSLNETTWYMGGNVPGKPREATWEEYLMQSSP